MSIDLKEQGIFIMKSNYDLIETLQEMDYFIIDIFPKVINRNCFFEIEKYYLKFHLEEFSDKIFRIIMQCMCYFDLEIYFSEFSDGLKNHKYAPLFDTNLANLKLKKLKKIVHCVICDEVSSLEVVIPAYSFLLSISGQFQVSLHNLPDEHLDLVRQIVEKENLYFRKP